MREKLCVAVFIACAVGLALFVWRIFCYFDDLDDEEQDFKELAAIVSESDVSPYAALYAENNDLVGWLSIDGTTIDYPVMQSKYDPNYYLSHNFYKEYSSLGTPFVQSNCNIEGSDNIIIYGHHGIGGRMFGSLDKYKKSSFYEQHRTIRFDTLTETGEYEIIAVFKTVTSSDGFAFYSFVNAADSAEFDDYVSHCKALSLYTIDTTAKYGDRLITLVTCEYSQKNGRLVIVAKKLF